MNITTVVQTKQLPAKTELRCYWLHGDYTVEKAVNDFEKYYRTPPVNAWQWGSYLYLEVPK